MTDELLRIEYGLERTLWQDPDQNQLDVWDVTLQTGELDDQAEVGVRWRPIARAVLYGIDIDRCSRVGESPFEVADAHSAAAAYYYQHVLEMSGEFQPDVEDAFEWPPSRALFLHDVNVDADQRRNGYASLLAADAILTLAPQGTAVFAHPTSRTIAHVPRPASGTQRIRQTMSAPARIRCAAAGMTTGRGTGQRARGPPRAELLAPVASRAVSAVCITARQRPR